MLCPFVPASPLQVRLEEGEASFPGLGEEHGKLKAELLFKCVSEKLLINSALCRAGARALTSLKIY